MKILFASKNKNKYNEIKEIFNNKDYEFVFKNDLQDVEEDKNTILDNAEKKAVETFTTYNLPIISDDSGLFVEALHGRPGVSTARYAGPSASDEENINKLLFEMKEIENRKAFFKTVLCFFDGEKKIFGEGILHGEITTFKKGLNGFGYDPIFLVNKKTLAELTIFEKTKISHRKKATLDLKNKLDDIF